MKDGFLKAAALSPALRVADCAYNVRQITEALRKAAARGVKLAVFPEFCLTGYTCGDLFLQRTLQTGALDALSSLLAETQELDVVALVGLPLLVHGKLYNCAAVLCRGQLLGIVPKTYLPNYGEFYEKRQFTPGSTEVEVAATCTETGTAGNGLTAGELSAMVDPVPYVASVTNTATTEGGAEIESDADLAERVFLAPGAYSTAGPEDGYLYHAKAYSPAIGDVVATSDQEAGTVDIVFIMADGAKPGPEMINGLKGYLQDKTIRPMTDLVNVSAPEEVQYTINMTYYINRSDSAKAVTIQAAVAQAVADYQTWQRAIGRDINPSKLVAMVMEAGAKRVTVTAPTYTAVAATKVSALQGEATVTYGGLEDD